MSTRYKTYKIGELGRVTTGKTPSTGNTSFFGGNIPFITPSDFDDRKWIGTTLRTLSVEGAASVNGAKVPAGAVMVSCIGSDMGKTALVKTASVTNQQINTLTVSSSHNPEYVYYLFRSMREEFRCLAGGSAQPILSKSQFERIEVELPTRQVQDEVASILRTIDDKLENNNLLTHTLEEMSQALFKSWFVDFDPVVAKSEGRKPFGMSDDIAALFPDSFEESELGAVPKGWRVERLDAVASIQYGKTLPTSQLQSCGFPVYGGGDIIGYWKDALCDQAVTLVTSRGSNSGMVWQTYEAAFVTNNSFVIRPKEFAARELVHESLKLGDIQQLVTGSAQPQLTIANFSHLPIVIPSDAVLNRFHEISGPMWERRCQIVSENRILTSTRDLLLPHLLSDDVGSHGQILTPKTQEATAA